METANETLGGALPKEIARCQELLLQYAAIGPVGTFGATMIRADIAAVSFAEFLALPDPNGWRDPA